MRRRVQPLHTYTTQSTAGSRAEPCVCLSHTPQQNTPRDTSLDISDYSHMTVHKYQACMSHHVTISCAYVYVWRPPRAGVSITLSLSVPHGHRLPTATARSHGPPVQREYKSRLISLNNESRQSIGLCSPLQAVVVVVAWSRECVFRRIRRDLGISSILPLIRVSGQRTT